MNSKLVVTTINNLIKEINKIKGISDRKKNKYLSDLEKLKKEYNDLELPDYFQKQYTQLNLKGNELLKVIKDGRKLEKVLNDTPVYIRYLKASLMDFQGKTNNLKHYLLIFYITGMLFFALTPQFYSYILPIIFIVPIILGVKGCKNRSINGFYMSMSIVPVSLMTSVTWIKYGLQATKDFDKYAAQIASTGIAQGLAEKLVYIGSIGGIILFIASCVQLYLGIKNKDLFV